MPHDALRRNRPIGRVFVALLAVLALVPAVSPAHAQGSEFASRAKNAILMDADTGSILYQRDADELRPPASMSKLMTLLVLFKKLKGGEVKLDDEFLMSVNAWRKGGAPSGTSAMMVPVNTKARVDELLQGIVIQSGNDACISVAENIAGSEEAFAREMEREARRIGLKSSTFRNATGLYHPEHLMSARELAELARHIIKEYPDRYALFGQKEFQYRKHRFINRNPLLFTGVGADGLKTGYIKEAGYGLVGSAVQEGRRLIVVVNGLETAQIRKEESAKLLEWGFRGFAETKVFNEGEIVGDARVWGGDRLFVPLTGKGPISVLLPRSPANQRLKGEITYMGPLKPPIKKGDQVAMLRITSSTSATTEVPLYAAEDVAPAGVVRRGLDSLVYLAFGWVAL